MNVYCPMHQAKVVKLKIFPDYASTGIWCDCGLSWADPIQDLGLPRDIVDFVEAWNLMWEMAQHDYELSRESFEKVFVKIGCELSKKISDYYECEFDENMVKEKWFWMEKNNKENKK